MDEWLSVSGIASQQGWLFHGGIAIFGLLAGSFLNVVIYRIPMGMRHPELCDTGKFNLCFPSSHCPRCKHALQYWQNIPLLSWVVLKGRCHFCHSKIPASYPLNEAVCALVFLLLSFMFSAPTAVFTALILFWFLLALSLIDLSTSLLPDCLTLPLLWVGLLIHSFSRSIPLQDAVYGAAVGYLSLWSLYWLVKIVTGKEGMGYGDFKLLAALGAWMGWQMLPYIGIIAALTGLAFGVIARRSDTLTKQIPFGPSLSLAGMVVYISQESELVWLMFR